ncbi:Peptide methionine sulfoxide reductase MsrA [Paramicrosporidium saccamoebae]|uniref:peptide-methionine (S)-S-oxide reductase n=1 Tax=Paramicrosporidium saccamoebae TaxID=1246581 RepID=A0A2H9TKD3_9FUNG|nr:Peptide methionine sulfoxide reductase MsrA [Paramicrosporidium saccamoebae]
MHKLATFAAGCFWGVEEAFLSSGKIISTQVGYTGGTTASPTYAMVCTGNTGHAEAVKVAYDPQTTTYGDLLGIFWRIHNPTTMNRQGPDSGSQYRSAIFYHDEDQHAQAKASLSEQQQKISNPIVTQIVPASVFYPAEEYHQQYIRKTGRNTCHI